MVISAREYRKVDLERTKGERRGKQLILVRKSHARKRREREGSTWKTTSFLDLRRDVTKEKG
jgi:hypothetical protein